MNDLLTYMIKVSAGIGMFVLPYFWFLRRDPNLVLKRFYLVASLLFSWVIPLLPVVGFIFLQGNPVKDLPVYFIDLSGPVVKNISINAPVGFMENSIPHLLLIGYFAGVFFFLLHHLFFFIRWKRIRQNSRTEGDVYYTDNDQIFTLFNRVYLPGDRKDHSGTETILIHERAHIRQRHYLDLLFLELTVIFTWFNPFSWLISRMMKENHEHLADREVLLQGVNPAHYRARLLNESLGIHAFRLGHFFNHSLTKKRFDMMKKQKFSRSGILKIMILLPVLLFAYSFFAGDLANDGLIRGKVIFSDTMAPAEKATVGIRGTTTGTATNQEGEFSIPADKPVTLYVSYVGYSTAMIQASPGERMKIYLNPERAEIDINNLPPAKKQVKPEQKANGIPSSNDQTFIVVEAMPEFPGGNNGLKEFVYSHLKYPSSLKGVTTGGIVYVGFTVSADGRVEDIKALDSTDKTLEESALAVFREMPRWEPAIQHGKNVAVRLIVPVKFSSGD